MSGRIVAGPAAAEAPAAAQVSIPWTVYVAPGEIFCRVYAMPYAMRPGQRPADLKWEFQREWQEIGLMRPDYSARRLRLVCLAQAFQAFRDEIADVGAGAFDTFDLPI